MQGRRVRSHSRKLMALTERATLWRGPAGILRCAQDDRCAWIGEEKVPL